MGRFMVIFLILLISNFIYVAFFPTMVQVKQDGFEKTVSKEKTINTVQTHRAQRRLEAEKAVQDY